MQSRLLENLNPEQLAAVTLPRESAMILAGAGSGKTRVLTTRIAWLIQTGRVSPQALLEAIVAQAETEPGWVEYDITNPASGRIQTKMSYVCQVDDVYLGCGVYKNLVQA